MANFHGDLSFEPGVIAAGAEGSTLRGKNYQVTLRVVLSFDEFP